MPQTSTKCWKWLWRGCWKHRMLCQGRASSPITSWPSKNSFRNTRYFVSRASVKLVLVFVDFLCLVQNWVGGSVAEWLACWTQAQKARFQIAVAMLSGNSLRQIVHTHCASVHQAAKLLAALLRVAGVTAGVAESNGSLPPGLWLTSPAGWLPRTGIRSRTLCSVIEYGLPFLKAWVMSRIRVRIFHLSYSLHCQCHCYVNNGFMKCIIAMHLMCCFC